MDDIRFYGVGPHWYFRPFMGLLTIAPTHYEGLSWMGLYVILITSTPLFYSLYNPHHKYVAAIPMQNSLLQTSLFIIFIMSIGCAVSILPCGRYYYEPEAGYVGNP